MKNIHKVMISLAVFLVAMLTPLRQIFAIILLPSGWDDFVFYGAGVVLLVMFIVSLINGTTSVSIGGFWDWLKK